MVQLPAGAGASENWAGHPGAFASRAASFTRASEAEPPSEETSPLLPPLLDPVPLLPPLDDEPPAGSPTEDEEPPQAPMTHTASMKAPKRILRS